MLVQKNFEETKMLDVQSSIEISVHSSIICFVLLMFTCMWWKVPWFQKDMFWVLSYLLRRAGNLRSVEDAMEQWEEELSIVECSILFVCVS